MMKLIVVVLSALVALAHAKPGVLAAAPLAAPLTAPLVAPAVVTATSSQYYHRFSNGPAAYVAAPAAYAPSAAYVAAPLSPYYASAPLIAY